VTAQESFKSIILVNVVVPPRDFIKIYENIIDNSIPILIAIYTNTVIDDDDLPSYTKVIIDLEAQ